MVTRSVLSERIRKKKVAGNRYSVTRRGFVKGIAGTAAVAGLLMAAPSIKLDGDSRGGQSLNYHGTPTSAERAAAAKRAKAEGLKPGIQPAALPVPTPGGVADYFGPYPNYANSPIPTLALTGIIVTAGGAGYTSAPTVAFSGGGGSGAAATAQVLSGQVTGVILSSFGSGYVSPPTVSLSGGGGTGAIAIATVSGTPTGGIRKFVDSLPGLNFAGKNGLNQYIPVAIPDIVSFPAGGAGYASVPAVKIVDATGSGAIAKATVSGGVVTGVAVVLGGGGYSPSPMVTLVGGGPTKPAAALATVTNGVITAISVVGSDYYEIELGQYSQKVNTDLPATRFRGYRQTNTTDATVSVFNYLGPIIVATRDRPVRIKFTNSLPANAGGNLFIPVDTSLMGAGTGPVGGSYSQNRGGLHLHGGNTPWIADGTMDQWTTPATETTSYPKGVSVTNIPDMPAAGAGQITFYYTNQQTARLMFYHDHARGITRLNVYAGEAAGYLVTDAIEQDLINGTNVSGVNPSLLKLLPDIGIPLVIEDKTFVDAARIALQDPTWNWGTTPPNTPNTGDLWFPHVYMPNQNPYDIAGIAPMGRWDYGPWFFPPTINQSHGALPNPYYDPVNAPWEPPVIPGTPNTSHVPEAFMDTPLVNGTAYPYLQVGAKAYRFRILNACNDRSLNLQLYYAGVTAAIVSGGSGYSATPVVTFSGGGASTQATASAIVTNGVITFINILTPGVGYTSAPTITVTDSTGKGALILGGFDKEVKMVPANPNSGLPPTWPTDGRDGGVPDPTTVGPNIIELGSEGGYLPAPVIIPACPIGYDYNRRSITVLNILNKSLYLMPAERADVIIDFSGIPNGAKLIFYNDAPAPVPGFDSRLDYYTGDVDQTSTGGAPMTLPGYGPNTRTILQFQVNTALGTATPYNIAGLQTVLPAAFAMSQPPPIVPNAAYNAAYGKSFPVDSYVRIQDTSISFFNGPLTGVFVTNGGSGYTSAPAVGITAGGGTGALATAVIANGVVNSITITNGGSGYTSTPLISFTGGGPGTGAAANAIVKNGVVFAIQLLDGGSGYTSAPTVVFTGGGGTNAAATATIASGAIRSIQLTNPGVGYTSSPSVAITGGGGTGGTAVAQGVVMPLQPKAIQELFDDWGRMNATLGVEVPNTNGVNQTTIPYFMIDPPTEVLKSSDPRVPIGSAADGTQLWKITHNGVDTHGIHFHLVNVQLINRVGWDGVVKPPDPNEVGWKDTVRMNPLEDIIIAMRGFNQNLPFDIPNSQRLMDVTMPAGPDAGFTGVDPTNEPAPVSNIPINFGFEYVWHCHILGHEENDMMRSICFAVPPKAPSNLVAVPGSGSVTLNWTDNSTNATGFTVQRATNLGFTTGLINTPLGMVTTYTDSTVLASTTYYYRVIANNVVGDTTVYAPPAVGYPNASADSAPSNVVGILNPAYLVVRGATDGLWIRDYNSATNAWGAWNLLGATIDTTAAMSCGGAVHIVAKGLDGNLYYGSIDQTTAVFSGLTLLSSPASGLTPSAPTLAANSTTLFLVVRGLDNLIYYRACDVATHVWTGWNVLPTGQTLDSPAAAVLGNTLHFAVKGMDTNFWHGSLDLGTMAFTGWDLIGGFSPSSLTLTACPALNEICLVVRGMTNNIWVNTWSSGWAGWREFPSGYTVNGIGATVIGKTLHVIVIGTDGVTLWHNSWDLVAHTLSSWSVVDGETPSKPTFTS